MDESPPVVRWEDVLGFARRVRAHLTAGEVVQAKRLCLAVELFDPEDPTSKARFRELGGVAHAKERSAREVAAVVFLVVLIGAVVGLSYCRPTPTWARRSP